MNDSIRFDQSEATVQARGPLRWFRERPDYSDVVFGFMNRVADRVAAQYPGKLLNAYAYYWCENTPSFPVRPNVVPWLTADRTQWYDPAFAAQDRALIERWCRRGPRVVGIYDYLYGAPFFIPRVTTRLTAGSIQFAYGAGVRAYNAETYPHWAFDSPKLWVAARLLWDPGKSVDKLLDEYYRDFWRETAGPMRRFYERCEETWRGQSGPPWWIKYYQDEAQAGLFGPKVRRELRNDLEQAEKLARTPRVEERVGAVSVAFAATERMAEFCEARDRLSNAAAGEGFGGERGLGLIGEYLKARAAVQPAFLRAVATGGMSPMKLDVYFQNDPAPRAAERILAEAGPKRASAKARLTALESEARDASLAAEVRAFGSVFGTAGLKDPGWASLSAPASLDDRSFIWSAGPWLAKGEPAIRRAIRVGRDAQGRISVRFEHSLSDYVSQWVSPCAPGTYRAAAHCRARVSPGNETFLLVSWLDRQGRYVGEAVGDRLPPGDWSKGRDLRVIAQAPAGAEKVGIGVYVYHQTGGDFAEFSGVCLGCLGSSASRLPE